MGDKYWNATCFLMGFAFILQYFKEKQNVNTNFKL